MQYLRALCPKLPRPPELLWSDIATCGLPPPSRRTLPTSPHASYTDVAIVRTADINKKTGISLFVSETNIWSVGFHLPCSGDGRGPHHHDVVRLHKPIRLIPVPPALHWNLKMPTNIPVDDLIVSISVARRCHSTTACHNVSRHSLHMEEVGLTSRYRTWVSFLSTGDCTVRRRYRPCVVFQFPDRTRRELLHMWKYFAFICSKTSSDTTVPLVLRRVVFSQIPPRLCSKAASHAIDRVPGLSRVTLIYNEHVRMSTITEVTVQPNNARFVHCLDLLQPLTAFTTRSIQSIHVC